MRDDNANQNRDIATSSKAKLGSGSSFGLDLYPSSVVAFDSQHEPVERLMALQSAVARGVHLLASISLRWPSLSLSEWLRFRAQ